MLRAFCMHGSQRANSHRQVELLDMLLALLHNISKFATANSDIDILEKRNRNNGEG